MTRSDVYKLMAMVNAEFGDRFIVTTDKVNLWIGILGHATFPEAAKAMAHILGAANKFPPTVGELNQRILSDRSGVGASDWGAEWEKVLRAASNSAYNAESEASKLTPHTLSAIGGIPGLKEIASLGSESLVSIRAQFRQRYEAGASRATEKSFKDYIDSKAATLIDAATPKLGVR